jgi:CheY-like chemotaxis protein
MGVGTIYGLCADGGCKMSKNILVVEDEPASLELLSHFLRKEGYRVSEASDGAEAIELLDNQQFDLVLTDIRMPRLDGVTLTLHILSRLPTIPIITMTAFPSEDLRPIWGYGIPYLSKPLSLDELRSNIQRALS